MAPTLKTKQGFKSREELVEYLISLRMFTCLRWSYGSRHGIHTVAQLLVFGWVQGSSRIVYEHLTLEVIVR